MSKMRGSSYIRPTIVNNRKILNNNQLPRAQMKLDLESIINSERKYKNNIRK